MAYTHCNLRQAREMLAAKLQDSQCVYWSWQELEDAVREALRVWQCLTGFYRQRVAFQTAASTAFYDLRTVASTQYCFTVTGADLAKEVAQHLLEPATIPWTGSDHVSLDEIEAAIQRRRNQFLMDTGIFLRRDVLPVSPPPVGRVQLPDTVIDVRRAAWIDVDGVPSLLSRSDEWAMKSFTPGWTETPARPQVYSVAAVPAVSMQLSPPPLDSGELELISVSAGPDVDVNTEISIGVPDDFCWAVKWGALAELLASDGPLADPGRAQACEDLYRMAVELAALNPSAMLAQINDIPISLDSVFDLDHFLSGWQETADAPEHAGMAGHNLIAFGPIPDGIYGVSLDLVGSMPAPLALGEWLQVGREHLGAVLDLAQWVASFKMGGAEFAATGPLFNRALAVARTQNERLSAASFYRSSIEGPAKIEEKRISRRTETR